MVGREGTRLHSSSECHCCTVLDTVKTLRTTSYDKIVAGSRNGITWAGGRVVQRPIFFGAQYTETEARLAKNWYQYLLRRRDDGVRPTAVPECAGASHQPARALVGRSARRHVRS